MDTYLLLRSNKKSGPYSLQQLVSFGFKPYDLVWVEGKSAAWRYPGEVDGLKEYAPSTEEQPYDRFYKKAEEKPQEKQVNKPVKTQEETYVLPVENKTVTTSKKVFVAMPENHIPKKQSQPVYVKEPAFAEDKPVITEEKRLESKPVYLKQEPIMNESVLPKQEPIVKEKKPVLFKEEPTLNEKYSESLDDIKKRYTETYLSRKNKPKWTSTHTSILQVVGGAVFFCFLVVVVYRNFAGEDKPQSKTTIIQPDKRSVNKGTDANTSTVIPLIAIETNKTSTPKTQTANEERNIPDESLVTNTLQKKNDEVIKEKEVAVVEKKAVMPKVTEEIKDEEVKTKVHPININRLVKVKANNYKQRAFGGVMNLELTVDNDSKFALDKVIVELQYLKPSEQPIKTETIVFSSIEANGSKTLKIPDYLRGVKVAYKVMGIESSQYERYTAGL